MAKLFTFLIITIGLVILFQAAGLETMGSVVAEQLGIKIGSIHNFRAGALFTGFLVSGIAALIGAGVVMSVFGRGQADTIITAIYATPLVALIGDLITITVYAGTNWVGWIASALMMPLIAGYVIALWDWIRGRD